MRPNLQFFADLVSFTEEILNGKCAVIIENADNLQHPAKHKVEKLPPFHLKNMFGRRPD